MADDGGNITPMIAWYRTPVERELLKALHVRSDVLGFLQTGGYLGLVACTGSLAVYSASHWPWWVTVIALFVHGTFWGFMTNGWHELVHDSVFRTRALNRIFLRVVSFCAWLNHHWFWESHTRHHKYTLHNPADQEVILPMKITVADFFKTGFVNGYGLWWALSTNWATARGRVEGEWARIMYPESYVTGRRKLFRWARVLLAGHALIVAVSLWRGWWMVPVVTTLAPFYGGWLFFLHNNTQHVGLVDQVPDFRACCRTFLVNPFFQFLYWHMNFHTEHHMYASVPCYRLGALHRAIRHDLPECPSGLVSTWRQIGKILARQKVEPGYQYRPAMPAPRVRSA